MSEHAWAEIIGAIGLFVLVISVVLSIIWQFAITVRAKAKLAREDEYKRLAESAVAGREHLERQLEEIKGELAQIKTKGETIEDMLRVVE
ncbi:hypothetical protein [Glycomyces arizonensis]|uniref:hypothetical protein n=1 Tax=Glycomyces arizonensis TaxID=256035 RepID=UPI0003F74DF4|nr:hypothetical protein [Glycomyces arizonensis]